MGALPLFMSSLEELIRKAKELLSEGHSPGAR